jgi:ribosomal protein L16/L10AE
MFLPKVYKVQSTRLDKKGSSVVDCNHFRGNFLLFCKATTRLELKAILAFKKVITKIIKINKDKLYFNKPCRVLTQYKKSKNSRMGKGKGKPIINYFLIKKGTLILEVQVLIINKKILKDYIAAIKTLISKLPCSVRFIVIKQ